MRMKSTLGGVDRRLLYLVLCAPLLGAIGVLLAELVPDGRIGYHLLHAERAGVITPVERPTIALGTLADHFTECTALSVGLGEHPDKGFVANAMLSPTYAGCRALHARLEHLEATDTLGPGKSYLRYWHGYAVVTRPALGLTGVAGTRWIAFALLALTAGGMTVAVMRAFGAVTAALLVGPAALTTDMIIGGLAVQLAIGMSSAWLGGWLAFTAVRRRPEWKIAGLTAAVAGILSAYFDLMTTLPGAFSLAVVGAALGALAAGGDPAPRRTWPVPAAAAVGWAGGLAWMWAGKWIIAAAWLGLDDVADNVRSQIVFRLSGEYAGVSPTRTRGLTDNLDTWWDQPLTPWVVFTVVAILGVATVRSRPGRAAGARIATVVAIVVVPVVGWYLALNNHSQIHAWLVYRSLPIAFGALSAVVYAIVTAGSRPDVVFRNEPPTVDERTAEGGRTWQPSASATSSTTSTRRFGSIATSSGSTR
jgi:hypothetical protein